MGRYNKFVVIDTETLGILQDSVVLSVSACFIDVDKYEVNSDNFQKYTTGKHPDTFNIIMSRPDQIDNFGSVEYESAIQFWKSEIIKNPKNQRIYDKLFNGTITVSETLDRFSKWFTGLSDNVKDVIVFERGAGFDTGKLDRLYTMSDKKTPWMFWNVKEVRTFIDASVSAEDNETFFIRNSVNLKPEIDEAIGIKGMIPHISLHDATADAMRIVSFIHSGANF